MAVFPSRERSSGLTHGALCVERVSLLTCVRLEIKALNMPRIINATGALSMQEREAAPFREAVRHRLRS